MKYRKKPVVIDATQWHKKGDGPFKFNTEIDRSDYKHASDAEACIPVVEAYMGVDSGVPGYYPCPVCGIELIKHGEIKTLESGVNTFVVCPGDWIITGVNGEHYACKPNIFEKTYESESTTSVSPVEWVREDLLDEAIGDVIGISCMNRHADARKLIKKQYLVIAKGDLPSPPNQLKGEQDMREMTFDNPGCYHDALEYCEKKTGIPRNKDIFFDSVEKLYNKPHPHAQKPKRKLKFKAYDIYVIDANGKSWQFYDNHKRFDERGIVAKQFRVSVLRPLSEFGVEIKYVKDYQDSLGGGWSSMVSRYQIDDKYFADMECTC